MILISKKSTLLLAGLFVWLATLCAQDYKHIINNPLYYWGEGYGITLEEADQHALVSLMSSINVNISQSFDIHSSRVEKNGKVEKDVLTSEGVIMSYSTATLSNTTRLIIKNQPDAHVVRWILKSEVEKIFASRQDKITEYINAAIRAEKKGKVDDALRSYYWALVLTQTMQHPNKVTYTLKNKYDEIIETQVVMVWVPEQMKQIFDNIKIKATKRVKDDVELYITYKGIPVNSLDYTFFDGRSWSPIFSAKDGVGTLELASGNDTENYNISIEFEYRSQACIDTELKSVLSVVKSSIMPKQLFRSANIIVKAAIQEEEKAIADAMDLHAKEELANTTSFGTESINKFEPPHHITDDREYCEKVLHVIQAVQRKTYKDADTLFTPEGHDIYTRLLNYGNAKLVGSPRLFFYKNGDKVVGRGLQMSFSFMNGVRKQFIEDIVFTFNKDGKIEALAFGLGKTSEDDILNKGWWDESTRIAIMEFLENYKTAYALKRLDYIEGIFDKDAVIVTGTVLKKTSDKYNTDKTPIISLDENQVLYKTHTKMDYLKKLQKVFHQNEFINIRFSSIEVKKIGLGGETYGIQVAQDYYSTSYGDRGYLFLLVDLNNTKQPTIKIRTWQPQPDSKLGGDGIIGIEDF